MKKRGSCRRVVLSVAVLGQSSTLRKTNPEGWVCGTARGIRRHIPGVTRAFSLILFLSISVPPVLAAEKEPVSIKGDQVEYFDTLGKVVATGNVEAVYQDSKLTCDRATIYMQTKDAYLEGRVRLIQPDGLLKGEEILYNFETRKGTILEAEGEAGEWRSKGDRADKISPDSYIHRGGGYLTSCDFEQPHTRMRAREVRVFLDDKVVLKDVVMQIGSVPLFYLPSYTHLLDDKRPRVTIIPGKDKQWGLFLLTSWRVYLNENLQGRFHVDFREQMDLATGFDLNYRLPVGGRGVFRNYYTHQRDLHREHFWSNLYGSDPGDPTTERERYRFQLQHVWEVDDTAKMTLEYNRARDGTVVKDFFEREFEQSTATGITYLQFIKTSPWFGLSFLVTKRVNRFETLTQSLPSISMGVRPLELPWLPDLAGLINWLDRRPDRPDEGDSLAKWSYLSSYKYEHSNVADSIEGTKEAMNSFDSTHEIFHPMRLLRRLNFRPFFRFRQTSFSRGKTDFSPQFRQAGAVGFDLNSKLFRVFDVNTNLWNLNIRRLRHLITPGLSYLYQAQPTINADKLLRADGLAKSNTISPGLEQKLQTKRSNLPDAGTEDLVRFTTSMPYNIEGPDGRGGEWQSVNMNLEMLPYPWLRFQSDGEINPHIGKFSTINADLILNPGVEKGQSARSVAEITDEETGEVKELPWAVGLGWRYQRNSSAQLTFETEFNLGRKWRAGIYQAFDVKRFVTETTVLESRTVKKIYTLPEFEYRLRRDLHEWTVELLYNVRRGQGETVLVLFRLKAAPELPFEFERNYHQPKAGRNFGKKR